MFYGTHIQLCGMDFHISVYRVVMSNGSEYVLFSGSVTENFLEYKEQSTHHLETNIDLLVASLTNQAVGMYFCLLIRQQSISTLIPFNHF